MKTKTIGNQSVNEVNQLLGKLGIGIRVSKVIDATDDIVLPIEPEDIEYAKRENLDHCAAALCAKRYFGGEVIVSRRVVFVVNVITCVATRFVPSAQLSRAIVIFDGKGPFQSGNYVLRRPMSGRRLGDYKGAGGPHKKKRDASRLLTNLSTPTKWRSSLASIRPATQ